MSNSFLHDDDAWGNPKLRHYRFLAHKSGITAFEAYGIWCFLLEQLRASENLTLTWGQIEATAHDLSVDFQRIKLAIAALVGSGNFQELNGHVFSPGLIDRIDAYERKSKSASEAGKASAAARKLTQQQTVPSPAETFSSTIEKVWPTGRSTERSTTPIEQNSTKPNKTESNKTEGGPGGVPDPLEEHLKLALSKLEEPKDQPWVNSATFVNTSRRPMKDYPSLFFTGPELARVLKVWVDSGIPGGMFQDGFMLAESRAKTAIASGKPPPNVEAWMLGFVHSDLLQKATNQVRLTNAKQPKRRDEANIGRN